MATIRRRTPPLECLMRRALRQEPVGGPEAWMRIGCLLFPFSLNNGGYGAIRVEGRTLMAHRVAWQEQVGPIPAGLELDHRCRVRSCIEVAHLEAMTHRENDLRGASPAIRRHLTGICVRGHEFAPGKQCQKCRVEVRRQTRQYLRSIGYPPKDADRLSGHSWARQASGIPDLRGAV